MYQVWQPRHGVFFMVVSMAMLAIFVAVIFVFGVHAQDASTTPPSPGFDWRQWLSVLVPALWAAVGPIAIKYVTLGINKMGAFVPRYIQVPLSGVLGASAAALTAMCCDVTGAVAGATVAASAVTGTTSQIYAATEPEKLRTDAGPAQPPQS